jgi:hypothetical protein
MGETDNLENPDSVHSGSSFVTWNQTRPDNPSVNAESYRIPKRGFSCHAPRKGKLPAYRHYKRTGQAVVTLPDGAGGRKDYYLGPWGSEESKKEYARIVTEWQTTRAHLPAEHPNTPPT